MDEQSRPGHRLHRHRHECPEPVLPLVLRGPQPGGTNTKQRNLRHLFTWLEAEYGHPHPYTEGLSRYAPAKTRPSTLASGFIQDLLTITGGGRARDFEDARDHAIIRFLIEGVRRAELVQLQVSDLPLDLYVQPYVRVTPLKGARSETEGRIVPLGTATIKALSPYLRTRQQHRLAGISLGLWLGTRHRGPITGHAVWRMVKRRSGQAASGSRAWVLAMPST